MRRIVVIALSVILALVVAAPIASGQSSSQGKNLGKGQNLGKLTGDWWNWAVSMDPSPLEGSYKGGERCEGEFVDGVFFLAGSTTVDPVKRTCTVPADTPILFPVVNAVCSEAPTVEQPDGTFTGDPEPYTKCSKDFLDQVLVNSTTFATLNGQNLEIQRLKSGPFTWKFPKDIPKGSNLFPSVPPGRYDAAANGLWVYLPQGLEPGKYTLKFGGKFPKVDFRQKITYHLKVK